MFLIALAVVVCVSAGYWFSRSPGRPEKPDVRTPHEAATSAEKQPALQNSASERPVTDQAAVALIQRARPTLQLSPTDQKVEKFASSADDWDTESLHDATNLQLKKLAKLVEQMTQGDLPAADKLVNQQFSCEQLWSDSLTTSYEDGLFSVQIKGNGATQESTRVGPRRLLTALQPLANDLSRDQKQLDHVKLKQVGIQRQEAGFTTTVLYNASSHSDREGVQHSATWHCSWEIPREVGAGPALTSIQAEDVQRVAVRAPGGRLYADATAAAFANVPHYGDQILRGIDHWLPRIPQVATYMWMLGYHGLAVGDVNGDGLEDLYVCETGGLPNQLYLQNNDGTLRDAAADAGVNWLDYSTSALLVDLDNDGDQDLVVSLSAGVVFAENDGAGRFQLRSGDRYVTEPQSLSAVDYDQDGYLDIYLCGYLPFEEIKQLPMPLPYHDANNGGRNALLRNLGDFKFSDVTNEVGLDVHNRRFSFAAAWEDYDNDGDQDLYVANDFGRNCLYRNDGGRFTDVAAEAGVEDVASGMSVSFADYNRDGRMDLYVSNMFSAAGQRIAFQRRFAPNTSSQTREAMQRMARGNTLFTNQGDGKFRDDSVSAKVTMGRWAWASSFADLNNDSAPDILVANGFVTAEDTGDL